MPCPNRLIGSLFRTLVLGSALAGAGGGSAAAEPAAAPPPWPAALYNPQPLADDLILPLPCSGALAFRPVATPAGSPRTKLVGAFAGPAGGAQRYLLIGKYEVSALQYQAVMASGDGTACPPVADAAATGARVDPRLAAQVGVSRIDAVNFTARLSRWLQANAGHLPACPVTAGPCLPRVEGRAAFVRLPLDLEWEYAARGGALVADDAYVLRRYPMPEGLERHAWYNRNADGEIAPIGRRLPNPLGLHDLYGNAWELMNDPYSSPQFPGQVGGDVLMGGGIHSADEELRADRRVEVQPYDVAGDVNTPDTGFRVVLAAPVVTSGVLASPLRIEADAFAMVLVDGAVQGSCGPGQPLEVRGLTSGSHRIEASPLVSGYAKGQATVEVTGAAPVLVRIHLAPIPKAATSVPELTSVQRRRVRQHLSELGYPCDGTSDRFDRAFRVVLSEFQRESGLPVTGDLTVETQALLERRSAERRAQEQAPAVSPAPGAASGGRYFQMPDRRPESGWMDPVLPGS